MFKVIPKDTFDNLQIETGVLLSTFDPSAVKVPEDADIICATTGGITATCTPKYTNIAEDVDNAPDNVKEFLVLDGWDCGMSFTSLRTAAESIRLYLGAADIVGNKITPRGAVKNEDFRDIWWVGDRADGGCVAIKMKNALSTGGFSLKTEKKGKGQISVTLTGYISVKNQDEVPMEFYSIDKQV